MEKYLLTICSAVLFCACASTGTKTRDTVTAQVRPAWIDAAPAEYPRSRFLTGVSSADDLSAAKDRARGEIAKVFSTKITMNTAVTSSENTYIAQGLTEASSAQNIAQNLRAVAQKNLEGVEIAQIWRDEASGQYYALAVLDRSKALTALAEKTQELDARAADTAAQLAATAEKLQKAKHALVLLGILKAREALAADRRVLNPAGAAEPGPDTTSSRRSAAQALSDLDVALLMSRENSPQVAAAVIRALNVMGIEAKTAAAADGADIAAECAVEFAAVADTDSQSRWHWYRGTAAVALKNVKTSKVFLNFDAAAKEAAANQGDARAKTETALGKKISAEISRGIADYLANQ